MKYYIRGRFCTACTIGDFLVVLEGGENSTQMLISLLIKSNGIEKLVVCFVVACLIQLLCQVCQLIGVSGVMALHIGDQSDQLLHGSVAVLVRMVMGMMMVVAMAMSMSMGMLVAAAVLMLVSTSGIVQMLVRMGMLMVMAVTVRVDVGVLCTVMGMSVGVFMCVLMCVSTVMIVFKVH